MAKRERKGEEGGYNFMDTYGDMVTLILTFFVLLFASSSMDESKWRNIVEAFTGAAPTSAISALDLLSEPNFQEYMPNAPLTALAKAQKDVYKLPSADTGELVDVPADQLENGSVYVVSVDMQRIMQSPEYLTILQQFDDLFKTLKDYVEKNALGDLLDVDQVDDKINLRLRAGILFESGSATIAEEFYGVLDELAAMIQSSIESIGFIDVEGHTDNVPIARGNPNYVDNRELSSARAGNVVRYFENSGGIPPEMILAVGHGEYAPIAPNDTEENRQINRRVQIVLRRRTLTIEEIQTNTLPAQEGDVS